MPLGWAVLTGMFGALLRLPDPALWLSPLSWVPKVPAADLDVVPLLVLTVVGAGLVVTGAVGYRRRDVPS